MSPEPLIITFPEVSVAQGNVFANTLADALRDLDSSIVVDRQREQSDTQDFGSVLSVVLGAAPVTALAGGLAAWLRRNSGARIEIRRKGKLVLVASHLDSQDVPQIVKALSREA